MLDLNLYADQILSDNDKPIFDEAVRCANAGALRAAYVMIWISCAESLKRRFREAARRDHEAGRIVADFVAKEDQQRSVDKLLLNKAKSYGFLKDSSHQILLSIYQMRCVYGHPYEEGPEPEQVTHAASMVVSHLLSQGIRLKRGFAASLLKRLLEDPHFLDDDIRSVEGYAPAITEGLDGETVPWFLEKYWEKLEIVVNDPLESVFVRRGIWLTAEILGLSPPNLIDETKWHEHVLANPRILLAVLSSDSYFELIGDLAQSSLFSSALAEAPQRPIVLHYLDVIYCRGLLSDRLAERWLAHIKSVDGTALRNIRISTRSGFEAIIDSLKSRHWYTQEPVVQLVLSNGPGQVADLSSDKQEILGRNILQTATGGERSARSLLEDIASGSALWPLSFNRGLALECFVNEQEQLRFKVSLLNHVLSMLERLPVSERDQIVGRMTQEIRSSTPKGYRVEQRELDRVLGQLACFAWTVPLVEALRGRTTDLVFRFDHLDSE